MAQDSILTQTFIETTMVAARKNLERDGKVVPALFVRLSNNQRLVVLVDLAATSEQKQAHFAAIGRLLRKNGQDISEAMLVSEGWFVKPPKGTSALDIRPSQHPQRREAIVLIGRDAAGERASSLVQPFGRDPENKPLWEKPVMAIYNQVADQGYRIVSLLDQLFINNLKGGER